MTPPDPALAARRLALEVPVVRHQLRCGLQLLVSPRPGAPVTAAQLFLRGCPAQEPEGKEGLAYLVGALADQGTRDHTEEELAELLERAGGSIHGDAHGLSGNIASPSWKLLLGLMAEIATRPTFPQKEVRRQKQRLLDRLLLERDDPRVQGEQLFRRLVYGGHWLGRPAYGSIESVEGLERGDLVRFHRRAWIPERAVLGICGDVDPDEVRRVLERSFRDWQPGRAHDLPPASFPPAEVRLEAFRAERAQVHLFVGHLGIRRNHPDYAALVVMDHVLGTGPGFTNRISRRLRDELGLAYSVHAAIHSSAGVLPGTFTAYIGTSPKNVGTAVEGFLREIRRIQEEPVGREELQTAKDYLVGSFALSFQRASRRASYLVSVERHGLPEDNLERLPRQFAAVSAEDVQRVAREHLWPDRPCVAAAGPIDAAALRKSLRHAGLAPRSKPIRA